MIKSSNLLDDMAKIASDTFGSAVGASREMEKWVKSHVEAMLSRLNLVTREEFEVVRAMATKAREEQEKQAELLQELQREIESLKVRSAI